MSDSASRFCSGRASPGPGSRGLSGCQSDSVQWRAKNGRTMLRGKRNKKKKTGGFAPLELHSSIMHAASACVLLAAFLLSLFAPSFAHLFLPSLSLSLLRAPCLKRNKKGSKKKKNRLQDSINPLWKSRVKQAGRVHG